MTVSVTGSEPALVSSASAWDVRGSMISVRVSDPALTGPAVPGTRTTPWPSGIRMPIPARPSSSRVEPTLVTPGMSASAR